MVHEWDVPMFPVPPKYRPPKRERVWPEWRRYTGARISCNDCITDIAAGEVHFMATPAAYVRTDADGRAYYCVRHAQHRRAEESRQD